MSDAPVRISVVIPLYDKGPHVVRTLESVRAQTHRPLEVVVVDDGSTDGGADLVAERFPDVRLIRRSNAGVSAARNLGMRSAAGDWVALLDADDVWLPCHLEELARTIRACPDARMVSTRIAEVRGAPPGSRTAAPAARAPGIADYFAAYAREPSVVTSSTAALHRATALRLGGFGPWRRCEDLEFWARVALRHPVALSARTTAWYVRGIGGAMESHVASGGDPTIPASLAAVDPSCATVCEALERGAHGPPAASLKAYLDARLTIQIKSALVNGHTPRARALFRLLRRRARLAALPMLALAALPQPLAAPTTAFARRIRGHARRRDPGER